MHHVYCMFPIRTEFPVRIGKNISEQLIDGFCILNENLYEERQGQILRTCIYIIVTQYETWLTLFCRPWWIIC